MQLSVCFSIIHHESRASLLSNWSCISSSIYVYCGCIMIGKSLARPETNRVPPVALLTNIIRLDVWFVRWLTMLYHRKCSDALRQAICSSICTAYWQMRLIHALLVYCCLYTPHGSQYDHFVLRLSRSVILRCYYQELCTQNIATVVYDYTTLMLRLYIYISNRWVIFHIENKIYMGDNTLPKSGSGKEK